MLVDLTFVEQRAEAFVLAPFPPEEINEGLLLIEGGSRVVEDAVVFILGHLLH